MMDLRTRSLASRQVRLLIALGMLVAAPLGFAQEVSAQASDAIAAEDPPPPATPPPPITTPPPATPPPATPPPPLVSTTPAHETACSDGMDDDGDGLIDCADADCFDADICHAGGSDERTDAACSDWVDNDGDGMTDCDDQDCQVDGIRACQGSYRAPGSAAGTALTAADEELPELGEGMSVEDLIGRGDDVDGERNDEVCADGIDNDMDGRTDCQDFGCRFDPQVTVCQGTPGVRFSVVAFVGGSMEWQYDQSNLATGEVITEVPSAGFTRIQLRALGPIPFIENSFFLINVRAERGVRLTFLHFQVPISDMGHYVALNSGFGGLSSRPIVSAAVQPLLDQPFYLTRAFEQGNGGSLEVGGPIDTGGITRFRLYGAAGSGEFSGSVGGGFFRTDDRNFTYTFGTELHLNIVGYWNRLDSPFIYTPVPLTLGVSAGVKYDQRAVERFIGWDAFALFRVWHFGVRLETYQRYVLDYDGYQAAWNAELVALIVPRVLMFAGDVGGVYQLDPFQNLIVDPAFQRQLDQFQWRVALHWFFFRSTGTLALRYSETYNEENVRNLSTPEVARELTLEARFRF